MILRRFMQHVKEQNWFAVGLDVIVVIVGIFLGMQVTEWQAQRNNEHEAQLYLHNLKQNLLEDIQSHERRIESMDALLDEISTLSEELSDTSNDLNEVKRIPSLLLGTYPVRLETATIEELKSTGNLNLISNKVLIESLLKYYKEIGGTEENWLNTMAAYSRTEIAPYIMKHYSIDYSINEELSFNRQNTQKRLNMANMRDDIFLMNAMAFRELSFATIKGISSSAITQANDMIVLIESGLSED